MLSFTLTKNCDVALFGSPVRAIATVPTVFFSLLPASLTIGAAVFFRFISLSRPPPWIMKPSMTRWNRVPA